MSLQAQFQLNGIIKDSKTEKPLPFATLKTEKGNSTITDVDGKFHLTCNNQTESLTISYVGYESKTISFSEIKPFFTIYLTLKTNALQEVATSNINPANALIAKVNQQKDNNNPQKKLHSFQFKSYNKLVITANPDSIEGKIDTVFVNNVSKAKIKFCTNNSFLYRA